MAYRVARIPGIAAGFIGLSFTTAGCVDGQIADDGDAGETYYTETNYTDVGDEGPYCVTSCCYDGPGCYDDGYYPTTYGDDGPLPDTGYDTGYDDGYYPTTDVTLTDTITTIDTETTLSTSTTTGTDTDTDTGTGTDTSTGTDTGTGTGTDTGTTDTGTGSSSSTGEPIDPFPPAGEFGDDIFGVQETDLIGTWSLQWAPDASTGDSILTIDDSGNFTWRETSADCSVDTLATGFLWVEPGSIVMHVDTWERQLPWDTLGALGEEFPAPFRLRMTYALLGPNLGLAGPDHLTTDLYTGRAQLQESAQGIYIAGKYTGEAELTAVRMGETLAKVIVRDRFISTLDIEPGLNPESTGITVHDQVFWGADPPVAGPTIFEPGNWTCLNGCPQPAGATLINGGNLYAYGPYAAYQRLMVFATGRSFKRDVDTDCPP